MQQLSFDSRWRFHLGEPEGARWREPDYSTWRVVDLPHDWSVELDRTPLAPSKASGGYFQMGRGWYRKTFNAPAEWQGKKVTIEFEGVYMNAEVWLNHNLLGRHPYGYTSFHYDLTPYLKIGEENVLTVKVDNDCQLNSRWYSGSGIYRHVWVYVANPVHVGHWGVYVTTPSVSEDVADVSVGTTLVNEGDTEKPVLARSHVVAPEGAILASDEAVLRLEASTQSVVHQRLEVAMPRLWSPAAPHLYSLITEIVVDDEVVDTTTTPFGIRSIAFDAKKGFLLNGQEMKLRGGCVHHDDGVMGATSYDRAEERKVERLKANGYNAIRCAHNPPAPAFLDACDRLGMLVIDEAFDCWREGKNPYDYHVAFADWWQRDLDSMLLRDRNHPSIIMWSIGNEVHERNGRSDGATIAQQLANRIREVDPTRPVTAAVNGGHDRWPWSDTDAIFSALDVGGYNYQEKQYRPDHDRHPDRIMYGSESTAGEALEHWEAVEELPYVIGDFVWTSLDYLGEAGIGRVYYEDEGRTFLGDYPWHQANCGDLDLCGFKRPQSFYRDILWGTGNQLYIAVHAPHPEGKEPVISYWGWPLVSADWTWPGHEGETFQVDVYSAFEQVELYLNDRSLGKKPAGRDKRFIATFDVPYEPGSLTAIAYEGDQRVAKWEVHTVDEAVGIRLTPDHEELAAEPGSLSFVTVEVVDELGRRHPKADHEIFFTVQGEGTIAAVGNGDPLSEERYRGNQRSAYEGRCLVVVKSNGTPGEITLRAQADGLEAAQSTIQVVA
ncbi:MAG: sugar-binding domain-containing protein [Anaerolineae bacterium]